MFFLQKILFWWEDSIYGRKHTIEKKTNRKKSLWEHRPYNLIFLLSFADSNRKPGNFFSFVFAFLISWYWLDMWWSSIYWTKICYDWCDYSLKFDPNNLQKADVCQVGFVSASYIKILMQTIRFCSEKNV